MIRSLASCGPRARLTVPAASTTPIRRHRRGSLLGAAMAFAMAPVAMAQVDVTITADNAYSFGYGTVSAIGTLYGGVNNTSAGAIFNCVGGPEAYANVPAPANSYLYIVAHSDNSGTQGVLGQFVPVTNPNGTVVYTGTSGWQVFATGTDIPPTLSDVNFQIGLANSQSGGVGSSGGWVGVANNPAGTTGALALGEPNTPGGTFPQVCTTAIASAARWMWYNPDPSTITDPFSGNIAGEYLIFRLPIEQVTNPKRVIVNKDIQNTSGQTVAGVEILIAGQPSGIHDIFHGSTPVFSVTPSGTNTMLRWTGGNIPANAIFHVGFNMPQQSVEILGIWLVDSSGNQVGCAPQCNSNLHLYGFGGDITYKNSVTACSATTLYCGAVSVEWHANEVDLALLNGTSPRFPMRVDLLPTTPVAITAGATVAVPITLPARPAGANYAVFTYVVGTDAALTGPVTRDWIEWPVDQLIGEPAAHIAYGVGCYAPTPLTLTASPAPVYTSGNPSVPVTYTLTNVVDNFPPFGVGLPLLVLSTAPVNPGIDLGLIGMPGCDLNIASLDVILTMPATAPTSSLTLAFPQPLSPGLSFYAQGASLFPPNSLPNGQNSFGAIMSNGLQSRFNTF